MKLRDKLKAFTIIEMMVVMLLSGIVLSLTYTCYRIVVKHYKEHFRKGELLLNQIVADRRIANDFIQCEVILRSNEGFRCVYPGKDIIYSIQNNYFIREDNGVKDTMSTQLGQVKFFFLDQPSISVIDEMIYFDAYDTIHAFQYKKTYSSEQLMSLTKSFHP